MPGRRTVNRRLRHVPPPPAGGAATETVGFLGFVRVHPRDDLVGSAIPPWG